MKIRRTVLTTDFSDCARAAYKPAVELTQKFGGEIHLVYARESTVPYGLLGFTGVDGLREQHDKVVTEKLSEEATDARFHGAKVTPHFLNQYGADGVVAFAKEVGPSILVQSSHGRCGFKHFILGSFAERVLRLATTPVLTLKSPAEGEPEPSLSIKTILFPHDFSACSSSALDSVRAWAKTFGAKVVVGHAYTDPAGYPLGGYAEGVYVAESLSRDVVPADIIGRLEEFATQELRGIEHEAIVRSGPPDMVLPEIVDDVGADLVCMSTHGWTGLPRMLMGSITEKLVRTIAAPVLTVRPEAVAPTSVEKAPTASQAER